MKLNRILFFAVLAMVLTACGAAPATNWPGMTTDGDNTIYLADGSFVYVVNASTGTDSISLRFPEKADATKSFYTVPALTADGYVVVGNAASGDHSIYGLTAANMQQSWQFSESKKPWLGSIISVDDVVYAPGGDGTLYKFTQTGEFIWKVNLSEHSLWSAPVTDGETLYIATQDHAIFALSPATGETIWKEELDNGSVSHPALADGVLYVGTLSGNLYALKAADGSQIWMKSLEGGIWGTPALSGDLLFIGTATNDKTGKFYAINKNNSTQVWMQDETGAIVAGPLATAKQVFYVTETGDTKAYSLDGVPQWNQHIENAKIYTPPMLVNDAIVIAPMNVRDYLLVAYSLTGAQKWTFVPSK